MPMFNAVQFVNEKLEQLQTDVNHKSRKCSEGNFSSAAMINGRTPIESQLNPKITSESHQLPLVVCIKLWEF
jgi:hypothetical protein